MILSDVTIKRPVLATVLNLIIVLIGAGRVAAAGSAPISAC
jgi:hypothetical protein